MKKNIFTILILLLSVCLFSCGDDDDDDKIDLNRTKTVKIEIDGSDNLVITAIAIAYSEGGTDTYTNIDTKTWTKEITYKGIAAVAASATTSDGKDGSLKVRMIEGGKTVSEGKSEGTILTANASH